MHGQLPIDVIDGVGRHRVDPSPRDFLSKVESC
jgi:hypothetical protein